MKYLYNEFYIYIKFFISLFAVINPIGMIPIFASLTDHQTFKERNKTNIITNITVVLVLCTALFLGNYILKIFNISLESFRVAGGILIMFIAYSMINGELARKSHTVKFTEEKKQLNFTDNISVVPLAMPLIAGPGAISSTIIWGTLNKNIYYLLGCSVTIIIFSFFCWFLFRISPYIAKFLGNTGMLVLARMMGLLLMSLGMQSIISGLKLSLFNHM